MTDMTADRRGTLAGFTITPADAGDHDTLSALHAACFSSPWSTEEISHLLAPPNMLAFLAHDHRHGAAHCGFIMVRHAADETEILTLGVVPPARRRGAATALLASALAVLEDEGMVSMFLEVAQDNTPARDFYRSHGFCRVGRRGDYYQRADGSRGDAIVMRRAMSNTGKS